MGIYSWKTKSEILSKIHQRMTNIIWYYLYMESKKLYKWTYVQNKNRLTGIENKHGYSKGGYIRTLGLTDTHYYI